MPHILFEYQTQTGGQKNEALAYLQSLHYPDPKLFKQSYAVILLGWILIFDGHAKSICYLTSGIISIKILLN